MGKSKIEDLKPLDIDKSKDWLEKGLTTSPAIKLSSEKRPTQKEETTSPSVRPPEKSRPNSDGNTTSTPIQKPLQKPRDPEKKK